MASSPNRPMPAGTILQQRGDDYVAVPVEVAKQLDVPVISSSGELTDEDHVAIAKFLEGKPKPQVVKIEDLPLDKQPSARAKFQEAIDSLKSEASVVTPVANTGSAPVVATAPVEPTKEPGQQTMVPSHTLERCPNCHHDLSMPAVPDPTDDDKRRYLALLLGDQPFQKEFRLFSGHLLVRVRSLTIPEQDRIMSYVNDEIRDGRASQFDRIELFARFAMYLQVIYMAAADGTTVRDLPDGLSPGTNDGARRFWEGLPEINQNGPLLPAVEKYLLKQVIRTDTLYRVLSQTVARFNRFVAKMEALKDAPDFLDAIGSFT